MKKKLPLIVGGAVIALLLIGAVGATIVYAQQGTPAAPSGQQGGGPPGGGRGFGLGQAELKAAADVLGMTTDDLSTALKNGTTLEQLATQKGVDYQKVKDAMQTARRDEIRTQINQAVTDGKMTQDKADWLLEGLDKGYLDNGLGFGLGFGPGFGFGFSRPRGGGQGHWNGTPVAPPTQSSGG